MENYDQIVKDYFEKEAGHIVLLSKDQSFYNLLRGTLFKFLSIRGSSPDCLCVFSEQTAALSEIQNKSKANIPTMVLVERVINNKHTTDFILNLKKLFAECKLILLSYEISEHEIALVYELGIDNIIIKPVSVNSLIQKMAFTIRPHGELNQLMTEGKKLLRQRKYDEVLHVGSKILEIKPNSPAGLMLSGDALLGLGRREEAFEALEKAHEQSHLFMEPIKKLAEFFKGWDDNEYLKYLKKLDKISPLSAERKYEIGKIYLKRSEIEEADAYFEQAVKCGIKEAQEYVAQIMNGIAESLLDICPDMAEKYYSKMLDFKGKNLNKDDLETFNRLGIAMRKQGKWEEAVQNYMEALKIAPQEGRLYYNIGLAYAEGKEYRKSAESFKQAVMFQEDIHMISVIAARNIAGIFIQTEQFKEARQIIRQALKFFPNDADLRELLNAAQ